MAFSQENDGGIVKVEFYNKEQSLTRLRQELPLHNGAFLYTRFIVRLNFYFAKFLSFLGSSRRRPLQCNLFAQILLRESTH